MDYAVYNPDQPTKEFLLRIADDGSEEVLPADQLQEDVEHEELKVETLEGTEEQDSQLSSVTGSTAMSPSMSATFLGQIYFV